jgi:hypothetical protein
LIKEKEKYRRNKNKNKKVIVHKYIHILKDVVGKNKIEMYERELKSRS